MCVLVCSTLSPEIAQAHRAKKDFSMQSEEFVFLRPASRRGVWICVNLVLRNPPDDLQSVYIVSANKLDNQQDATASWGQIRSPHNIIYNACLGRNMSISGRHVSVAITPDERDLSDFNLKDAFIPTIANTALAFPPTEARRSLDLFSAIELKFASPLQALNVLRIEFREENTPTRLGKRRMCEVLGPGMVLERILGKIASRMASNDLGAAEGTTWQESLRNGVCWTVPYAMGFVFDETFDLARLCPLEWPVYQIPADDVRGFGHLRGKGTMCVAFGVLPTMRYSCIFRSG